MSISAHTDAMAFSSLSHNFDNCHVLLLNVCVCILAGGGGRTVFPPQLDIKLPDGVLGFFKNMFGCSLTGRETEHLLSPAQWKQE